MVVRAGAKRGGRGVRAARASDRRRHPGQAADRLPARLARGDGSRARATRASGCCLGSRRGRRGPWADRPVGGRAGLPGCARPRARERSVRARPGRGAANDTVRRGWLRPRRHRLTHMATSADLRSWIALLEREGELVRVSAEVDPHLEVTEIVDRTVKAGGPALLFENPKDSSHPLLINQFGTERRMCLAFDAETLDEVGRRLGDVLEMQPPQGLAEKVRGLKKLKSIADSQPKTVRGGAAQEVVLTGDEVDLSALPVQTCWPGDAAPFITLPAVITKDPRTGTRNVGMYRMQVLDEHSTAMHWQIHKDGRADYLLADGKLDVAVALGLDP